MHCDGGGSNGGPHPPLLCTVCRRAARSEQTRCATRWTRCKNTRVNVTVTNSDDSDRASLARIQPSFKTFPETEAQPKPMFTQPSWKLQQSQTQQREPDSTNNDGPNNLDVRINFSVCPSSLNCGLQARYMWIQLTTFAIDFAQTRSSARFSMPAAKLFTRRIAANINYAICSTIANNNSRVLISSQWR